MSPPFLTSTGALPPIPDFTSRNVSAEERVTAIDFVNRNNFVFEEFDNNKMLSHFTPDVVTRHFHGTLNGHDEVMQFFKETYPYLIPGVSRHATNHIVDRDEEFGGVVVRYHTQLIREAWPQDFEKELKGKGAVVMETDGLLPQIWISNIMVDRLVMTDNGWKIKERHLGPAVVNPRMHPTANVQS